MFISTSFTEGYRPQCQDRAQIVNHADGLVIVVADGAGGTSGGAEAADYVVRSVTSKLASQPDVRDASIWAALLTSIDHELSSTNGQTTAVVIAVLIDRVVGASVGDSAAWIVNPDRGYTNLTAHQIRKPLLGTGQSIPVPFQHGKLNGTLLVASDGLIKYGSHSAICEVANDNDLQRAAPRLADLVRLKSRSLQDDIAIVLCRSSP